MVEKCVGYYRVSSSIDSLYTTVKKLLGVKSEWKIICLHYEGGAFVLTRMGDDTKLSVVVV